MKKFALLIILLALLVLSCTSLASAKSYHMTLLTIGEVGDDTVGGTADAYLEITPGTGRIFLDSFPLTKIDTQISTRYANEIACDHLDMDCSRYDFFYTIRAGSTIVGGPSASGALTVLTIATLKDLDLREDTVMTGTINSGGSIGPVGGIVKKAVAAEKAGFKRVLVPQFSFNLREQMNQNVSMNETLNIINKTNNSSIQLNETETELTLEQVNLSIEVLKVRSIEDALMYFTDVYVEEITGEIQVPDDYTATMKQVADSLCTRALDLHNKVVLTDQEDINKSEVYIENINKGFEERDYYSTASYCFTLGVLTRKANLREIQERYPSRIPEIYQVTKRGVKEFNKNLEEINLTTLSELETYIIVKERLLEAEENIKEISNNISTDELAYAIERYYSAVYWSEFFKIKGKKLQLDPEYLETACYKKLSEAEERINYASIYVPLVLQNSRNTIKQAYAFSVQENYKMCLFKASFAKAESNLLLSSISIDKDQVEELANEKLKAAKKVILKEQTRDIFPILGYSYYEYATTLKDNGDPISSLIFGEYSLELSNIEIYFPRKEFKLPRIDYNLIILLLSALLVGLIIGIIIGVRSAYTKKKKVKKKKKKK